MSYKQCIFGIPTARAGEADVLALVRACMVDLAGQGLNIPRIYVLLDSDARARRTGLRTFMLGTRGASPHMLTRAPLFEFFYTSRDLPVVALLHDDQHGVYLFESYDFRSRARCSAASNSSRSLYSCISSPVRDNVFATLSAISTNVDPLTACTRTSRLRWTLNHSVHISRTVVTAPGVSVASTNSSIFPHRCASASITSNGASPNSPRS